MLQQCITYIVNVVLVVWLRCRIHANIVLRNVILWVDII